MIDHPYLVAGQPVLINVVETEDDLEGFRDFIRRNVSALGVDSETTGLDIFSDGFRLRVVQFGNDVESWVIPVERGAAFVEEVRVALMVPDRLILQNAAYDLQVFDRCLGVPMEKLWPKVQDTKILAHLIDPRGFAEGGSGHSLQELTGFYIDQNVADNVKGLMKALAAETPGASVNTIWKKVPFENKTYQLYSGMDPILAYRLYERLYPLVPGPSRGLIAYEHQLAEVCALMERTGFLLDVHYTSELATELKVQESLNAEAALNFGCENVNSTDQVADVLETLGVKITGRTPSGKRKVDDHLLAELIKSGSEAQRDFAQAVTESKKAGKWRKTWVQKFLDQRDSNDRCHASINPLQARTARMSITGIPAQTLPAGDSTIRRCFVADPGQLITSVDYQAQELRVLAALSKDRTMIQAFREDADLHLMTAQAAFGPQVTKDGKERKWAKVVNFGRVYGGGAKTVAEQTGLDLPTAKRVVDGFDRAYPGVKALSAKLQREAIQNGYITTPTGRRLPVDADRAYSALNYLIQSSSRDVTGRALVRLHRAGFTPYMRLPIHDEVLLSMPESKAKWGASKVAEIMAEDMDQVHIGTDAEVGGRSWGSLYGADF